MTFIWIAIWIVGKIFSTEATEQVSISSTKSAYEVNDVVVITCTVPDFNSFIGIQLNDTRKVQCYPFNVHCAINGTGYTVVKRGTTMIDLNIAAFNPTNDAGYWICVYGTTTSSVLEIFQANPITTVSIEPEGVNNTVYILWKNIKNFTCTTDPGRPAAWIQWYIDVQNMTNIAVPQTPVKVRTNFKATSQLSYIGRETGHNKYIYCEAVNIEGRQKVLSSNKSIYIQVPVTSATIQPDGINNIVSIVSGVSTKLTCTTDASRPAAWIQWYIGERNVTNDAEPQTPQPDGTKFIATSTFNYNGNETDHNLSVSCKAGNVIGESEVQSLKKLIYIQVPVTSATILSVGTNNTIYAVSGESKAITCKTDASRPAAWIQWYIDGRNVTADAVALPPHEEGTKFISSSTLNYTGVETDHKKHIHCEALNINGRQQIKSEDVIIYIQVPVTAVKITVDDSNGISVLPGESTKITCRTDASRPVALIQWYINELNVTSKADQKTTEPNGTKFISSSTLMYKGYESDHDSYIHCEALNINGRQTITSENKTVYILAPVENLTIEGFENTTIAIDSIVTNFTCKAENARPAVWIHWYIGEKNVTTDATEVSEFQTNNRKYNTISTLQYTGMITDDDKRLICAAGNTRLPNIERVSKRMLIKSRVVANGPLIDSVHVRENQEFILSIRLIANPIPTINWTFVSSEGFPNGINDQYVKTRNIGKHHYMTMYSKPVADDSDFGNYTVIASNGIGEDFMHVISLIPSTVTEQKRSQSPVGGIAGGVAGGLLLVVLIIVTIVLILRRIKNFKDADNDRNLFRKPNDNNTDYDEDGLKDNPLYICSGSILQNKATKGSSQKSIDKSKDRKHDIEIKAIKGQSLKMDCVYENSDDLSKLTANNKTESSRKGHASSLPGPIYKKNKDGLQYVDLEFSPKGNTHKFVIKGQENRTNYAIIDLSIKAEPLPESDDDDDQAKKE